MISFTHKGDFRNTKRFLTGAKLFKLKRALEPYGRAGVLALSRATPVDTGITAHSWDYELIVKRDSCSITWTNSNMTKDQVPVAILLQYGHATRSGKYIQGVDYINPALRPIFDRIATEVWKEIISL